jgi:hypothetical protein
MSRYQSKVLLNDRRLAVLDIETISSAEVEEGVFPPWASHVPVVVSILTADCDPYDEWQFAIVSIRFGEDHEPFERIEELLRGRACVTFSGRAFDLPCLSLTAQASRKFCLPALSAAAAEPRFSIARHYDLADKYSRHGAARGSSLAMLCDALGIASKVVAHGDEVGELYNEGKIDEICQYCEGDVASTLLLYAHCRAMEKGDPTYHAALTSQFVRWILAQGHKHLEAFAEIEGLADLLRYSLLTQINAACRHAQLDADLQAKRALDASFTEVTHY